MKVLFLSLTLNSYYLHVNCIAILRRKLPPERSIFGHNNQCNCEKLRPNQREVSRQRAGSCQAAVQLFNTSLYLFLDFLLLLCGFFQLGLQVTDLAQVPGRLGHAHKRTHKINRQRIRVREHSSDIYEKDPRQMICHVVCSRIDCLSLIKNARCLDWNISSKPFQMMYDLIAFENKIHI